jgi:hypothetical protein
MAETLVQFQNPVTAPDGTAYQARAIGAEMPDGMWQGWIEFEPIEAGDPIRSPRETTQPNRADTIYWATGLTAIYLDGALRRALAPLRIVVPPEPPPPHFDGPAPVAHNVLSIAPDSVLDPFSVYEKGGEDMLRRQLAALSGWHLGNIIVDYGLSGEPRSVLSRLASAELVELIVLAVQSRLERVGLTDR